MGFVEAVKSAFSNYANFSGRAQRSALWFWILFIILAVIVTEILDISIFGANTYFPLTILFSLATLLPYLAVGARRLHDIDRSGWWWLIAFIPIVGGIILIIWWCKPGQPGTNRFGPNPLGM
jgi:uncharacterized membrane protein YhaH (DUF805 family)